MPLAKCSGSGSASGAVRLAGVGRESGLLHDVLQAARREHQEPVFLAVMAEAGRQVEAPALATVMAGLGPAIHAFAALQGGRLRDAVSAALPRGAYSARVVDGQPKAGHDE